MSYQLPPTQQTPTPPFQFKPQPQAVRKLACQLWEQAGRPEGQSIRFWKEAEEKLNHSETHH